MARLWHCPKCASVIVVTVLMEDFPFNCPHCKELWGREDMEHFALGLSAFDVADVHDWLEQRKTKKDSIRDETVYGITSREQILLHTLEVLLDRSRENGNQLFVNAIEESMKKYKDACHIGQEKEIVDWCEAQWQQEREQDARSHIV